MQKKLVILSGAGISAESGLKTFRDSDGLWENYNVYEVATPEAWAANKELVLEFYNARRRQVRNAKPNLAHTICAELEQDFNVSVITQNIDDLHERAGSKNVLHLHGKITQARPENDDNTIVELNGKDIYLGDTHENGSQLRPHVVWFGEAVPMLNNAADIVMQADILAIVGTSLQVYPAASLHQYFSGKDGLYLIDPNDVTFDQNDFTHIKENATKGMETLRQKLLS